MLIELIKLERDKTKLLNEIITTIGILEYNLLGDNQPLQKDDLEEPSSVVGKYVYHKMLERDKLKDIHEKIVTIIKKIVDSTGMMIDITESNYDNINNLYNFIVENKPTKAVNQSTKPIINLSNGNNLTLIDEVTYDIVLLKETLSLLDRINEELRGVL